MGNTYSCLEFPLGECLLTEQDQLRRYRENTWSSQLALGTASGLSKGVLWFDFSSELVFWNCQPCVLIFLLSFSCLYFLAGISKGSFESSKVMLPSYSPQEERQFSRGSTRPYCTQSESPFGEVCFPHRLPGDLRDIYLIRSLQWPFWDFPFCVPIFLSWICKLNRNCGIDWLLL